MSAALAHRARTRAAASLADESGSTAIEYALIASLIGLAIMGSIGVTGNSVAGSVNYALEKVAEAIGQD